MTELTLGETRMRIEFSNPKPGNVYFIRKASAELINVLSDYCLKHGLNYEAIRSANNAQAAIETAAEIAVKAVTDGNENEKNLINFGNFLLSEEREASLKFSGNLNDETIRSVHQTDLENWKSTK